MELLAPSYDLIFLSVAWFLLWLIALIDILRNEFKGQNEKLIWVLLVLILPFLGAILYFFIGRKNKVKLNQY